MTSDARGRRARRAPAPDPDRPARRHRRILPVRACDRQREAPGPAARLSILRGLMRMSHLFARTLREDPADAEIASHRLLLRGAYVRKLMAGVYTTLPLGVRTMRKIETIVR